jgi:hypothetical protein
LTGRARGFHVLPRLIDCKNTLGLSCPKQEPAKINTIVTTVVRLTSYFSSLQKHHDDDRVNF